MIPRFHRALALSCLLHVLSAPSGAQSPAPVAAPSPEVAAVMARLRQATPTVVSYSVEEIDRVHAGKGLTDCFWVGTLHPRTFNILSPDLAVTYWISQFRLPAGARLELKGQYLSLIHI